MRPGARDPDDEVDPRSRSRRAEGGRDARGRALPYKGLLGVAAGGAIALVLLAGCGGGETGGSATSGPPSRSGAAPSAGLVAAGKGLYVSKGCNACHSLNGARLVGPTWRGLSGSSVKLANDATVTADAAYLLSSIEDPDRHVVAGYKPGVMSGTIPRGAVSSGDAEALVAFIESLR